MLLLVWGILIAQDHNSLAKHECTCSDQSFFRQHRQAGRRAGRVDGLVVPQTAQRSKKVGRSPRLTSLCAGLCLQDCLTYAKNVTSHVNLIVTLTTDPTLVADSSPV